MAAVNPMDALFGENAMTRWTQVKLVAIAILVLLVVVVVMRNLTPVPVKLLMEPSNISLALLMFVMLAIGFAVGLITAGLWGRKKRAA